MNSVSWKKIWVRERAFPETIFIEKNCIRMKICRKDHFSRKGFELKKQEKRKYKENRKKESKIMDLRFRAFSSLKNFYWKFFSVVSQK